MVRGCKFIGCVNVIGSICISNKSTSYTEQNCLFKKELNNNTLQDLIDDKIHCIVVDNFATEIDHDNVADFCEGVNMVSTGQGPNIRSDIITWLPITESENSPSRNADIASILLKLASLTHVLSTETCKLQTPSHIQLSHFSSKEANYVKHRDNKLKKYFNIDDNYLWFSQEEQSCRYITCVVYITPNDWNTSRDGGALRCYLGCDDTDDDGFTARNVVDVIPKHGRLVVFKSENLLHEVLPTYRKGRYAFTVWLLK